MSVSKVGKGSEAKEVRPTLLSASKITLHGLERVIGQSTVESPEAEDRSPTTTRNSILPTARKRTPSLRGD